MRALLVTIGALTLGACGRGPSCAEDALPGLCGDAPARAVGLGAIVDAVLVDLDGDADDELVVITDAPSLAIARSEGRVETIALAGEPSAIAAGDLDGDGRIDVAIALRSGDAAVIFRGDGDGGLAFAGSHPVGHAPRDLWLGDLDGDDRLEIITADAGDGALSIVDGVSGRRTVIGAGEAPSRLVATDLDGDARLDLAALDFASGAILGLHGRGDGGVEAAVILAVDPGAAAFDVGDLDGDGLVDLVTQSGVDGQVVVRFGEVAGSFGAAIVLEDPRPVDAAIAVIAAEEGATGHIVAASVGSLAAWTVESNRTIGPRTRVAEGDALRGLLVDDGAARAFVGDDWVHADALARQVRLAATWDRRSPDAPHVYVSGEPAFGDLDGDGELDLAVNTWRDGILTYHGDGLGGFEARAITPAPSGYVLAIADVSGDGRSDLAVVDEDTLWIALQGPDGGFTPAPILGLRADAEDMVVLRGGARARLAVDLGTAGIDVVRVGLDGAVVDVVTPRPGLLAARLRAGDLDGDGVDDLAVLGLLDDVRGLATILSQGTGFIAGPLHPLAGLLGDEAAEARELALGDLDGDGALDAVIAGDDRVARVLGPARAAPTVAIDPVVFAAAEPWGPLSLGDLDGDGALDLLRPRLGELHVHRGDRLLGFSPTPELRSFDAEPRILPADLRRDARVDFLTKDERELRAFVSEVEVVPEDGPAWPLSSAAERGRIGDVDGRGRPSLVLFADDGVAVVRDPGGPAEAMIADRGLEGVRVGDVADVDGDGAAEIVVVDVDGVLWIVDVDGDTLTRRIAGPLGVDGVGLAELLVRDLDGDGALDLLLLGGGSAIAYGDGAGGFAEIVEHQTIHGGAAALADLDGDGRVDLLVERSTAWAQAWAVVWQEPGRALSEGPTGAGLAVLRGGDLVVVDDDRIVRVPFEGRSPGAPLVLAADPDLAGAHKVAVGDLDGDGRDDLITADELLGIVWLDRHGAMIRSAERVVGRTRDLLIADLDGGGRGDVIGVFEGRVWSMRGESP